MTRFVADGIAEGASTTVDFEDAWDRTEAAGDAQFRPAPGGLGINAIRGGVYAHAAIPRAALDPTVARASPNLL